MVIQESCIVPIFAPPVPNPNVRGTVNTRMSTPSIILAVESRFIGNKKGPLTRPISSMQLFCFALPCIPFRLQVFGRSAARCILTLFFSFASCLPFPLFKTTFANRIARAETDSPINGKYQLFLTNQKKVNRTSNYVRNRVSYRQILHL